MAYCLSGLVRGVHVLSYQKQFLRLASNKVQLRQISPSLQLLRKDSQHQRPLVLLYAWLAAKGRHKKKYADFYLNRGFDVLHISIKPRALLYPKNGQQIAQQLVDSLLEDEQLKQRNLVVHAFSVGGYMHGESLNKMFQKPDYYREIMSRIRGVIYDSPVGVAGIPEGFPKALMRNKTAIKLASMSLQWYLNTFKDSVTKHYQASEDVSLKNELGVPVLFLYSDGDPVATPDVVIQHVNRFRANENAPEIWHHCFADSPHVSHMLKHPVKYLTLLNEFLDTIGFERESEDVEKVEVKV